MRWLLALLLFLVMASATAGKSFRAVLDDGTVVVLLDSKCRSEKLLAGLTAIVHAPVGAMDANEGEVGVKSERSKACWTGYMVQRVPTVIIVGEDGGVGMVPMRMFRPLTGT